MHNQPLRVHYTSRFIFGGAAALCILVAGTASAQPCSPSEVTKLISDDGAIGDEFGFSVSVSGDTAVIGAYRTDDGADGNGSAYVYRFDGTTWVQEAKLLANDGAAFDQFGISVSISGSGDTIVVGARQDDDNANNSGSAYIFRFDGKAWIQEAKLIADDGAISDAFGASVSISGDTAMIGADFDDTDENGNNSGSVYVFEFDGTNWTQETKLLAADGAAEDLFGTSVSLSGDTAVIGAFRDDDNGDSSGSAYVFRFDGTNWAQEAKLVADDAAAGNEFGYSVSISGDTAVVGARGDDDNGNFSGSAYVFVFDGTAAWTQEAKLIPSDGATFDLFAESVSVSGGAVVVGARGDDDNGGGSGSAYAFDLNCMTPCPGDIADDFGTIGADGMVSFGDFLALLGLVGPCPGGIPGCDGDIADDFGTIGSDGMVSFGDFLALLGLVGPCP